MTTLGAQRFVFLVEPEPVLGLDLTDALANAGYAAAGPIRTTSEALAWATRWKSACAVVDASRWPDPAEATLLSDLDRRDVPTVVVADQATATAGTTKAACFRNPGHSADIVSTLQTLLSRELTC